MDALIPKLYKSYGVYVNAFRSFPLIHDGLKPVERRVLLSAYEIARDKFVKSAKINGYTTGNYHPHGDVYGTCVQLVRQEFLDPQGNFGNNLGVEPSKPAAQRYTECRLSKDILNMSFSLIKYVDRVESELDPEPKFIPTMFPLCLLGKEYTQGIGFGYRTFIPCYKREDLYKRLLWLLGVGDDKKEPVIKPISDSEITSNTTDLKLLLTTGKSSISTQGIMTIDPMNCKAVVKSWPNNSRFESILNKFEKELDNGDIGFSDLSNEETGNYIEFQVLKQRSRDTIFTSFVKKLKTILQGRISFEIKVVDFDGKVIQCSVDQLLLQCYANYKQITEVMLNSNLDKVREKIQEILDLSKLIDPLKQYLASKNIKTEDAYIKISEQSKLTIDRVKELMTKYKISKLLTMDMDITSLREDEKVLTEHLNKLNEFVLERYKEI